MSSKDPLLIQLGTYTEEFQEESAQYSLQSQCNTVVLFKVQHYDVRVVWRPFRRRACNLVYHEYQIFYAPPSEESDFKRSIVEAAQRLHERHFINLGINLKFLETELRCLSQGQLKRKSEEDHKDQEHEKVRKSYRTAIESGRLQWETLPGLVTDRWHPYTLERQCSPSSYLLEEQKLEHMLKELKDILDYVPESKDWTEATKTRHLTPSEVRDFIRKAFEERKPPSPCSIRDNYFGINTRSDGVSNNNDEKQPREQSSICKTVGCVIIADLLIGVVKSCRCSNEMNHDREENTIHEFDPRIKQCPNTRL